MLLNTLIIFFLFLIGYQIILANSPVREGVENQCDTAGDAYKISQQNSIFTLHRKMIRISKILRVMNY